MSESLTQKLMAPESESGCLSTCPVALIPPALSARSSLNAFSPRLSAFAPESLRLKYLLLKRSHISQEGSGQCPHRVGSNSGLP